MILGIILIAVAATLAMPILWKQGKSVTLDDGTTHTTQ